MLVLILLTWAFPVSLPHLKVDRLGYVAMDVAPPYRTAFLVHQSGYLSPGFPWWDGLCGISRFSEVVPPGAGR
jgi:hypothetical protein